MDSRSCSVKYQKSHIGYCTPEETELKYMSHTEANKLEIAAKIKLGVPCALISKHPETRVLK